MLASPMGCIALTLIDRSIPTNATDDAGVNDLGYNAQYVFVVDTTANCTIPIPNSSSTHTSGPSRP